MKTCPHCGATMGLEADIAKLAFGRLTRRVLTHAGLLRGQRVETKALVEYAYADDPTGGPDDAGRSLKVLLCKARPRLATIGLEIVGMMGRGSEGYVLRRIECA